MGPAGADKGKGGKYLILPPSHTPEAPDGYIVLPSQTYKGYALLRSIRQSGSEADLVKAVEYGKRIKIYPLSQADNPPPTVYIDAAGVFYDATIRYDIRFFESLNRVVQHEPWLERDRAMIDMLRNIGIEKGKPFAPNAEMTEALNAAGKQVEVATDWAKPTPLNPSGARQRDGRELGPETRWRRAARVNSRSRARRRERDSPASETVAKPCESWG